MYDKNLPATKQNNSPVARLKAVINGPSVQEQFKNALGKHADLFVASIIDIYSSDTYLQNCEPGQVIAECLKAATLKLPLNKSLGFAYVVPYKKNGKQIPQFQIGYKGFIQLAMRTGLYKYINADVVYEGELVSCAKDSGAIDLTGEKTSDKIIGYFAYIETLNGFKKTVYGKAADIEAFAKQYSASYKNDKYNKSAWSTNFDEMAIKTLIRRLLGTYGIMSIEQSGAMSRALEMDQTSAADQLKEEIANYTGEVIDVDTTSSVNGPPAEEAEVELEQEGDGVTF